MNARLLILAILLQAAFSATASSADDFVGPVVYVSVTWSSPYPGETVPTALNLLYQVGYKANTGVSLSSNSPFCYGRANAGGMWSTPIANYESGARGEYPSNIPETWFDQADLGVGMTDNGDGTASGTSQLSYTDFEVILEAGTLTNSYQNAQADVDLHYYFKPNSWS